MDGGFVWECPHCRGRLRTGEHRWDCSACGRGFRAWKGIPDLRTRDDVYRANGDDLAIAERLLDDYDRLDFRGLLARYYELESSVPAGLRERQVRHIITAPGRVVRWLHALGEPPAGPWLDLGCGSGSFLAAVGPSVTHVCGVDIALRWLLVARKRLDEEGLGRLPLVCACAEDLPIPTSTLSAVVAGDVIEHVGDQLRTLDEAHRVLAPGGRIFLASPNRFSLSPEPHVRLWGVGFLPRKWMSPYVRFRKQMDFRDVKNLGCREWTELLRNSRFGHGTLSVPPLPEDDLVHGSRIKRRVGRLYNGVVKTTAGQWVGRAVGPLFHVVSRKDSLEPPRTPSPTIPPSSRPLTARP